MADYLDGIDIYCNQILPNYELKIINNDNNNYII